MKGQRTSDPLGEIFDVAAVLRAPGQPHAIFPVFDGALARAIGHKLFTVLLYLPATRDRERLYTSNAQAYPLGGRKPRRPGPWGDMLFDRGEAFIGRGADDFRAHFPDHALLASLGCDSMLNVPVRYDGRTLGTLNLSHEAGWYDETDAKIGLVFAALMVPALLARSEP